MSERIDHAAEARRRLSSAENFDVLGMEGNLAAAQAHATLALVEQQRLASLIALRQADSDVLRDDEWAETEEEIREGLGL